jgi:hypothetical protein
LGTLQAARALSTAEADSETRLRKVGASAGLGREAIEEQRGLARTLVNGRSSSVIRSRRDEVWCILLSRRGWTRGGGCVASVSAYGCESTWSRGVKAWVLPTSVGEASSAEELDEILEGVRLRCSARGSGGASLDEGESGPTEMRLSDFFGRTF